MSSVAFNNMCVAGYTKLFFVVFFYVERPDSEIDCQVLFFKYQEW